jgi:hypothetical protein
MLEKPEYLAKWKNKEQWYHDNGFSDELIVSKDRNGAIDSAEIDVLIKEKILGLDLSEMKKSWDEIIKLSDNPDVIEFARLSLEKDLVLPTWGYEVIKNDAIVGELEFAWLEDKVAIYLEDELSQGNIELLDADGWNLFDFHTFTLPKLVKVVLAMVD